MDQYDAEDFDLGIKQFMIEQAIQQDMEEGLDKKGDNKDFEEKLAEQLFAGEDNSDKKNVRSDDVPDDAFTTEAAEEAWALFGERRTARTALGAWTAPPALTLAPPPLWYTQALARAAHTPLLTQRTLSHADKRTTNTTGGPASLKTAWRNAEHLTALSYTQFWTLAGEGHVEKVRLETAWRAEKQRVFCMALHACMARRKPTASSPLKNAIKDAPSRSSTSPNRHPPSPQRQPLCQVRVYGPEQRAAMVTLKPSAPGGARDAKVVLAPDPDLVPYLAAHGVAVEAGPPEAARVGQALLIQVRKGREGWPGGARGGGC